MSNNFHEDSKIDNLLKIREFLVEFPYFLHAFFIGIADTKSPRTQVAYAYDLRMFFTYLIENVPKFSHLKLKEFTLEDLKQIDAEEIELFMQYLGHYTFETPTGKISARTNAAKGKTTKLAAIRTMFTYYYKKRLIESNPAALVDFPKVHTKAIVRLEIDEVARLLDEIESGAKLTDAQFKWHEINKLRDLALVTLLLGTGMRITECRGINISHLDFNMNCVKIIRKGGNEQVIYFGKEVVDALNLYLPKRKSLVAKVGHEDALFLSIQGKRMSYGTTLNLVRKYSQLVTTMKDITPHKLRSTFGTALYNETNDIYLVAEILGHSDINTTKKHYAQMSEERLKRAANIVKLRED